MEKIQTLQDGNLEKELEDLYSWLFHSAPDQSCKTDCSFS